MREPDLFSKVVSPILTGLIGFIVFASLAGLALMALKFMLHQLGGL